MRMPMSAKKKKKKKEKTDRKWGHANANVLCADVLYEDVGGGSCRDGGHR